MADDLIGIQQRLNRLTGELANLKQTLVGAYGDIALRLKQIESYIALLSFLNPRLPLPPMTEAAITPEVALQFASQIAERRPALIVETGSGVSTLIAGYSLRKNGGGRLISLEHNEYYAHETVKSIERHQLESWTQVIHAPLTSLNIQGQEYSWYDRSALDAIEPASIGLLLVDGPPGNIQPQARYPALPVLFEYLKQDALILVDDAERDDEREMIRRWRQEFRGLKVDYLPSAKGLAIITFEHESKSDMVAPSFSEARR